MDDGLVLNIAFDSARTVVSRSTPKGGRWTDRVKAKRVAKRKTRPHDVQSSKTTPERSLGATTDYSERPQKRPRPDHPAGRNAQLGVPRGAPQTSHSRPTQFISSLFTSNPVVVESPSASAPRTTSRPSNAPLTDRSTFTGLGLNPLIAAHLAAKMNITAPTSIQREALPPLLSSAAEDTSDRDVFISSQTGSGKTLTFLLPIIQDLLQLSSLSYIDRSIGTLAIIITPTRELAKQISDVLETLLTLRLRPQDERDDADTPSARLTRWLVSGVLTGGATRTHEKARIRKGLPILVATPGRLLDHLQNTASFDVGKCRWLVLDEADRLMELGFEESIQGILRALEGRRKLAVQAVEEGKSMEVGGWDWNRRRRTVLCSATIREDVQHLAGTALVRPIVVKSSELDKASVSTIKPGGGPNPSQSTTATVIAQEKFTPPSQLAQKYAVVPLKLRLVTLVALLRTLLAQSTNRQGTKIIVFLSCTDSVDFHWRLLGTSSIDDDSDTHGMPKSLDITESHGEADTEEPRKAPDDEPIDMRSALLPGTTVFRLHGSLPQATRIASLKGFVNAPKSSTSQATRSSILLCTSVASRGLDLPHVRAVVQYDLPTEGGVTEYVHRVGRTARVGKGGEAWSFVAPSEHEWVQWIEEKIQDDAAESKIGLQSVNVDTILKTGLGGKGKEFEERATDVQLSFERWVLKQKENTEIARKAFQSHMRAYSTHPSNEKHMFHLRHLHIGHLAKAFALRDAPSAVGDGPRTKFKATSKSLSSKAQKRHAKLEVPSESKTTKGRHRDWAEEQDGKAEKRMREVVRAQGRLSRKGGVMVTSDVSEFQIPGGGDLEKLVARR